MGLTDPVTGTPVGVLPTAGVWALNLGLWPVLVAIVLLGDSRWLWRELRRDFGPVRRWLFLLPPDPPPVPRPHTFLYPLG